MNRSDQSNANSQHPRVSPQLPASRSSNDIPAGPIWRPSHANVEAPSQKAGSSAVTQTIRPQQRIVQDASRSQALRSAVVRPMPRSAGDGTLRFDQPAAPAPKLRQVVKLENFVRLITDDVDEVRNERTADLPQNNQPTDPADSSDERLDANSHIVSDDEPVYAGEVRCEAQTANKNYSASIQSDGRQSKIRGYRFSPITGDPDAMATFFAKGNQISTTQAQLAAARLAQSTKQLDTEQLETATDELRELRHDLASGKPAVVLPTESNPEVPVERQPVVQERIDQAHAIGTDTSKPHVTFTEESQLKNQCLGDTLTTDEAEPQIGRPDNPFSSVTYDAKTAEVISTISAAIASVLRNESEGKLKAEADALLQTASIDAAQASTDAKTDDVVGIINEEMLDDIIRQRFTNESEQEAVQSESKAASEAIEIANLLQRIDTHHDLASAEPTIPVAVAVEPPTAAVAKPITSIAAFASSQPAASSSVPPVATVAVTMPAATVFSETLAGTTNQNPPQNLPAITLPAAVGAADYANSVVSEVPMEVAAWDVEDFRWPVVTNQMIVTGGPAIEGLLSAVTTQLPSGSRRLAVSGVGRIQGATSIAISIARWAVAAGQRTLLIDADVASPNLSGRLGLASDISWLNGINNELPVSELIIRSKKTNLCVMPLASSITRVTWPRFIFDNLGELLDPILSQFDLVIVDSGPASQLLDELSSPARLIDGVMLVNDVNDPKKLESIQTRLATFGVERLILADNRVPHANTNVA